MKTTLLITLLFFIGTWLLVWGFPQIDSHYPGGNWYFTGSLTVGAFFGCIITDVINWIKKQKK